MTAEEEYDHEAWVRSRCPNVLDDDHCWGWWREAFGNPEAPDDVAWAHRCTNHGGHTAMVIGRVEVTSGEKHRLVSRDPLHVEPSILCAACGDHGFIRDGKWVKA